MIRDYVRLARVDHWFRNVFMLPGIVLGWLVYGPVNTISTLARVLIGVASTCLMCSSNYTIDEILDAVQDGKHPIVSYATACALFGGIFIIRYRAELILAAPVLAGFMGMYVRIGFLPNSPAQHPETPYKQKALLAYGLVTVIILIVCYVVRIPWLSHIFEPAIPQNL